MTRNANAEASRILGHAPGLEYALHVRVAAARGRLRREHELIDQGAGEEMRCWCGLGGWDEPGPCAPTIDAHLLLSLIEEMGEYTLVITGRGRWVASVATATGVGDSPSEAIAALWLRLWESGDVGAE